jgi:VCBS repeat-containing protein
MKKMFSFGKTQKNGKPRSSATRFLPHLEVLEDRRLLSVSSLLDQPISGNLQQNVGVTDMEMHVATTNPNNPAVVGIRIDGVGDFNPAAVSIWQNGEQISGDNKYLYINGDYNFDGKASSLVVAQLAPGDYTIRVGGDNSTYGVFQCDVFLPGDIDHDKTVSAGESQLTSTLYGLTLGQSNAYSLQLLEKLGYKSSDIKVTLENDFDRNGFISQAEQTAAIVNSRAGQVTATISTTPKFESLRLQNDTGASATDNITTDPAVVGKIADPDGVTIKASFDNGTNWTDITLATDGSFTLNNDVLKTISGGPVDSNGVIIPSVYNLIIRATNENGNTDATIQYTAFINHAPTGGTQTFDATEKASVTEPAETLIKQDTDQGDSVEVVAATVQSALGVTVTIAADGSFVYAPGNTFIAKHPNDGVFQDSFDYTVRDSFGLTGTGTITINITPENDAPAANPVSISKDIDLNNASTISFDPLENITDPDNAKSSLTVSISNQPEHGSVALDDNGNIVFTPGDYFNHLPNGVTESVTFVYAVEDELTTIEIPVAITVTGKDDAPIGVDDPVSPQTFEVLADSEDGISIAVAYLLDNDLAVDDDVELSLDSWTQPDKGSVELIDGNLVFKPNGDFTSLGEGVKENATFTYTVKSGNGLTDTATVTVTVVGVNSLPVISGDHAISLTEGGTQEISFTDLLALASDPNGDELSISAAASTSQQGATITYDAVNSKIIYNPGNIFQSLKQGATAPDTFTYTVSDDKGGETTGTITVTITGVNDHLSVPDNQTIIVTIDNDGEALSAGRVQVDDPDEGDSYSFSISDQSGKFEIDSATGQIFVKTGATFTDEEEIVVSVTVTNPNDASDTETQNVTIKALKNQPPTAVDVSYSVNEKAESGTLGPIAGITDPEDDEFEFIAGSLTAKSFSVNGVSQTIPSDFTASISAEGVVTFNPNGKFSMIPQNGTGVLALEYQVQDKVHGGISTGTITINIAGENDAPNAGTLITNMTDQNTAITIDVLAQASDPDLNDVLSIASVGTVTAGAGAPVTSDLGTASISDGKILFTPGAGFKALPQEQASQVQFTYTITDGTATVPNIVVTITVNGMNDAPIANNVSGDNIKVRKDQTLAISPSATDPDTGETASLVVAEINGQVVVAGGTVTLTSGATVTLLANGQFQYNPNSQFDTLAKGQTATDSFAYKVKDAHSLLSNEATIAVIIEGANDPPTITADIPDFAEDMGTTKEIDLWNYFQGTSGNGSNLNFSVEEIGADPSEMISASITDNRYLHVVFSNNYDATKSRNPVEIKVTATNKNADDLAEESISQTFTAVAIPQTTATIEVIPVKYEDVTNHNRYEPDSKPSITSDFEVKAGDRYYLEIWVTDMSGTPASSDGLVAMTFSLKFDTELVEYISCRYNRIEDEAGNFELSLTQYGGDPDRYLSTNGYLYFNLLGDATAPFAAATRTNGAAVVRILVEAKSPADSISYEILKDADHTTGTLLVLGRMPGGLNVEDSQVEVVIGNVKQVATSPLLAEMLPEKMTAGTVYPRVVTEPTAISADGTAADIPQNADWIHEWQEHWVELWVKASDTAYFINGTADLNYNSQYFTATEVEISPAFQGNSHPVINDAAGKVAGIGGDATKLVSGDGYILLGRVKFESIGNDNVPFSEAASAHDLGITVDHVNITTSANQRLTNVGRLPQTELWAVPYDANDDNYINTLDFLKFVSVFQPLPDAAIFSTYDYNKDGCVNVNDFLAFAGNFGSKNEGGANIKFPESFTQRYVGKKLDADNAATVNKIIDAANKAWQTALGLDQPIDVQIVVQDLSGIGDGQELANAKITATDAEGRPVKGIVVLDDDGAGLGWYSQIAEPVANGRYDLYTTLLHELGHVYGFNTSYDAFNEVVGNYLGQLDSSELHASNSDDVMYATLTTGVRKFISQFDAAIISDAYAAAKANPNLGFSDDSAPLTQETSGQNVSRENIALTLPATEQTGLIELENDSLLTSLNLAAMISQSVGERVDVNTAAQLHAMGLAVASRIHQLELEKPRENRTAFSTEKIFGDGDSFFELTDDDWDAIYQPKETDETELALFGFDNEFDADWNA